MNLALVDGETRLSAGRSEHHREALLGTGDGTATVRRVAAGDETDLIEGQGLEHLESGTQVATVHRIERPAEYADRLQAAPPCRAAFTRPAARWSRRPAR